MHDHLIQSIQAVLSPDLLRPEYRRRAEGHHHPTFGHCYAASEALFWLVGGLEEGNSMMQIRHEGVSHWFVRLADGTALDPTSDQFETPVPYELARANNGFVRQHGRSARASEIIRRLSV